MAMTDSVDDLGLFGPLERGFTFSLPSSVTGHNARSQEFTEDTILSYISHQGASFYLKNPVNIGLRLRLVVDLPEKLSQDKSLKLVIKGRVARVEALRDSGNGQRVTIHFDSKYIIKPED
jgi:hypothetical protein